MRLWIRTIRRSSWIGPGQTSSWTGRMVMLYTSIGHRTFSYAVPQIWNAIPRNIRLSLLVISLKRNLKHIIFLLFLTLPCTTVRTS